MKISIIIPAYNEEATIAQLLDLVVSRVHDIKEVIVIDDGSVDNTRQICLDYERKIH